MPISSSGQQKPKFFEKLYGSSDSSTTDASNTSENSNGTCFKASSGWLAKFKVRYHKLSCEGESLFANSDEIKPYKMRLTNIIIIEEGYKRHQLFNTDEIGLNWKKLQDTTLADGENSGLLLLPLLMPQVTTAYHWLSFIKVLKHCNLEILPVN